ncbi:MAG: InlB B-repeat-containing protein, partial [Bifidobacteriaceae bacterium]|nr:InlB B-repeat-containing protein [Bifidobacteriaceae bacterium]
DGGSGRVPVSWDAVPASRYAKAGSFTVSGKLPDGTKATATVKVSPRSFTVSFDSQGGSAVASQKVTEGQRAVRPKDPTRGGYDFAGWYTAKSGGSRYDFNKPVAGSLTLYARWNEVASREMFRLYNPNSGEHFYTAAAGERDHLRSLGWRYEGVGWTAPDHSGAPVYRLYNPNAGDHHYTTSGAERDMLVTVGWRYEGVGWFSAENAGRVALYREYNPNAVSGAHNYTLSLAEHRSLVSLGWHDEGLAWYAVHA